MSRTHRKSPPWGPAYRRPKTTREKKQVDAILTDPELKDYNLAKKNRIEGRYLPSLYDDILVSSWGEARWTNYNWLNRVTRWGPETNMGKLLQYFVEVRKELETMENDND